LYSQDARYTIEFISNWSNAAHPTDYPAGSAHWSPLIGTTHTDASSLFEFGLIASNGVEQVAETGVTTIITQEINILVIGGIAYEIINGPGLSSGLGTITLNNVGVGNNFPYISMITMIAPSPDWVAMISNLKLTDATGNWLPLVSVDVYATDVGTDSGTTYTSTDFDTDPRELIKSLENMFPFSDQIIGTFVFTLDHVLSVEESKLQNGISIYPNPSNGKVFIKMTNTTFLQNAVIYSVNGEILGDYNNIGTKKELNLTALQKGFYFIKLNTNNGSVTKKLIIR
jgi:hypothetical protein